MPDRDKWIHGRGPSLSTGLYRDIQAGTHGKKRHSTEPADWPWSKKARERYGMNIAFNKPVPESSMMLPKIVIDNSLTKEATQRGDAVYLGPKFFKLNSESKESTLYHELGHWYRDRFIGLSEIMGWEPGQGFYDLFGMGNSEEGFAEAFAVYFMNPSELKQRYPESHDKIKGWVKGRETMLRRWVEQSNLVEQTTFADPLSPDEKELLKRNKGKKAKAEALIDAVIALKEGLVDDAKRNLVAAGLFDADSDYSGMLGSAVLELVKKFAKQGHSGSSAYMTLELFDRVAKRKPLTAEFWYEEKQRLMQWLKEQGQLEGKHAMDQKMIDRFISDSLGPCPRTKVDEAEMETINTEELIDEVVSGKAPDEAIDEVFGRLNAKKWKVAFDGKTAHEQAKESRTVPAPEFSIGEEKWTHASYGGKNHFILKTDGKEVGEVAAVQTPKGYEISNIAVWPAFQRKGYGTTLYRKAYDFAKSKGKRLFVSDDLTDDAKAIHSKLKSTGVLKGSGEIVFKPKAEKPAKPEPGIPGWGQMTGVEKMSALQAKAAEGELRQAADELEFVKADPADWKESGGYSGPSVGAYVSSRGSERTVPLSEVKEIGQQWIKGNRYTPYLIRLKNGDVLFVKAKDQNKATKKLLRKAYDKMPAAWSRTQPVANVWIAVQKLGEAKELDTCGLIEAVRVGVPVGELLAEKVSYSYDIRHDQNIRTSPISKGSNGRFYSCSGDNLVTMGNEAPQADVNEQDDEAEYKFIDRDFRVVGGRVDTLVKAEAGEGKGVRIVKGRLQLTLAKNDLADFEKDLGVVHSLMLREVEVLAYMPGVGEVDAYGRVGSTYIEVEGEVELTARKGGRELKLGPWPPVAAVKGSFRIQS